MHGRMCIPWTQVPIPGIKVLFKSNSKIPHKKLITMSRTEERDTSEEQHAHAYVCTRT